MKKFYFLLILIFVARLGLFAQAPFTTLIVEPRFLQKPTTTVHPVLKALRNEADIKRLVDLNDTVTNTGTISKSDKNYVDFFKNTALSVNLIKGQDRASVSAEVLHYKLYVANPNEQNSYRLNRYNIPLLIISKLSTDYDSKATATAIDALDYEAAPLTIRVMPSFKLGFETYSDVFYFGFYYDLRGVNTNDPITGNNKLEFLGSGGIGLTYQADGMAGTYNPNGEYESGRYSVSLIYQMASGKRQVVSKLFDTENNCVSSFQGYFIFKAPEKSRLNFKFGYQYFFQKTTGGLKNNISLAIGV